MIKWTAEQNKAIGLRNKDIIISASAGSGKTTVMIERVLSLLAEGHELKDMLIVTFTRAAAADMKGKLAARLTASTDIRLKNAAYSLSSADISTLHSWCQKLISSYFYAVSLDPEFEVMEEAERTALLMKSITAVLEKEAAQKDPDFMELVRIFGDSREDKRLKALVKDAYLAAAIRPDPSYEYISHEEYSRLLIQALDEKKRRTKQRLEALQADNLAAGFARNVKATENLITAVESLTKAPRVSGTIPQGCEALNDRFKSVKKHADALIEAYAEAAAAGEGSVKYLKVLERLLKQVTGVFGEAKRVKSKLDFNDLEHFAFEILRGESGAAIRGKYKFVFVDEYQDINPLQDGIISLLKSPGNSLFLIGDLKQSIYAFRGCEPAIFADKIRDYAADPACEVIRLNANHRSREKILSFCNGVFGEVMTAQFGGTDYANDGRFDARGGDALPWPGATLHITRAAKRTETGTYDITAHTAEPSAQARDAALCVQDILQNCTVTENGETRKAAPSDIAVLIRSASPVADALRTRLNGLGIKTALSSGLALGCDAGALAVTSYLKLINNALDDESLINTMRAFGGFSDGELAAIRLKTPDTEFFREAVSAYNGGALGEKIAAFFNRLNGYRELSRAVPVSELAGRIVSDSGYFNTAFTRGAASAEALDRFLALIEESGAASLSEFLAMELTQDRPDCESSDAVRIMTVHASKGLEFPFVLLLNVQKGFNLTDLNGPILLDGGRPAIKTYDWDTFGVGTSAGWLYNRLRLKKRLREEELRLLYVAITRAKYRLDIFAEEGGEDGGEADTDSATDGGSDFLEESNNWLKWLKPFTRCLYHGDGEVEREAAATVTGAAAAGVAALPDADEILVQKLKERFSFECRGTDAPPKTYVTAIVQRGGADEPFTPPVLHEHDDRALERGVLYHKAMELIDFEADFDKEWDKLDGEITAVADKDDIKKAVSEMKKLTCGKKYYKEQPFMLKLTAAEAGFEGEGDVLVQGVIDLIIIDGKDCVIVDYKTGAIYAGYAAQLDLYATAAARILGLNITAKLVYSFQSGGIIL